MHPAEREALITKLTPVAKLAARKFTIPGMDRSDQEQDAVIRLIEMIDQEGENVGVNLTPAYLRTSVKNLMLDKLRHETYLDTVSLDEEIGNDSEGESMTRHEVVADKRLLSPEQAYIQEETRLRVRSSVEQLPEMERTIITERIGLDRDDNLTVPFRMISERMEIPPTTVKRIYHQGLSRLKEVTV